MLDSKLETLLAVAEYRSFTKAAEKLLMTQPAVSHHIRQLEDELGVSLFLRGKGEIKPTSDGEIVITYAKRFYAMRDKLMSELAESRKNITKIRVGITHTAESNRMTEILGKLSKQKNGLSITVITDTIKNLYSMLENYELDLAIVEGKPHGAELCSIMLDTDYLVCVVSKDHPLAKHSMITLNELRKERMILRLPTSATRILFESTLESMNESIESFNVILEVDNIATIKDLIRKDLGVSILARSTCMDELQKGKIVVLPIENLSMIRETNLVYSRNFAHVDILKDIARLYHDEVKPML